MSESQDSITGRLATYMAAATMLPLPEAVVEKTKQQVLDTIAAMVSGSVLLPGRKGIEFAGARPGPPEACVVTTSTLAGAETAAFANAMLAHSDETDDSHAPSQTHPGCSIVPAALALGERYGRGGEEFLRAVALGYDIGPRFNMALDALAFRNQGHATHSYGGTFGAAAAAGAMAGLDEQDMRFLLAYTAQQASGVGSWTRDQEHVEKAFVFGAMPARNGVTAAMLVGAGWSGEHDVLSGDHNFFAAYSYPDRTQRPELLVEGLGENFEIMRTNIKRWTVGSPIQAPLDSLLVLIREHSLKADDVERVVVQVSKTGAQTTNDREMPDISMQHMCALMLVDGIVTFESSHDEERMRDPAVLDMRRRIELQGTEALQLALPSRQGIVELWLRDGRHLRHHTREVRGTAENPMTTAEVDEKCFHLMAPVFGDAKARSLCDRVWNLESLPSLRELRPLLMS
jgi:2-methylcitrate dehydratase PrpD